MLLENKVQSKPYLYNRELSWLKFNKRVLEKAADENIPLAERLNFLSIYQSNLDEFFMVRIGANYQNEVLVHDIIKEVQELNNLKAQIYKDLSEDFAKEEIHFVDFNALNNASKESLENYFENQILPFLSPIVVGSRQPFPFLENKDLYIITSLKSKKDKDRIGIIPCNVSSIPRLISINRNYYILREDFMKQYADKVFEHYDVAERTIAKVTRNADIDIMNYENTGSNFRSTVKEILEARKHLNPVCMELSDAISESLLEKIATYTNTNPHYIFKGTTPLDFKFFGNLRNTLQNHKDMFYPEHIPYTSPSLKETSVLSTITEKDLLFHYPYDSMKPFLKLLKEASEDIHVKKIDITLYRVAERSEIIRYLKNAAENGKEVTVCVELRARFDEENNIEISKQLEEAGCHVIYGPTGYKVHSKLCLITKENDLGNIEYVTQVGTGNYHEKTAKQYTDLSYITANENIGKNAEQLFSHLKNGQLIEQSDALLIAPNCLQNILIEKIDKEIEKAKQGLSAYIGFKINALTDEKMIDKLVEASKAGVKIKLNVRGICCLIPGILGYTENIEVSSIVGRFLEHSRIYEFGEDEVYIASADLMTRNIEKRVEVAIPILDDDLKNDVKYVFDMSFYDNVNGQKLLNNNCYDKKGASEHLIDSQSLFLEKTVMQEMELDINI